MLNKIVGEVFKKLRKENGHSLRDLAPLMEDTISHLSRIENGLTSPRLETIVKLCDTYKINLQAFFTLVDGKLWSNDIQRPVNFISQLWVEDTKHDEIKIIAMLDSSGNKYVVWPVSYDNYIKGQQAN